MYISVVIPVYNEADSIPELCQRLVRVCQQYPSFEIIAVDDGSTDSSLLLLKEQQQQFPQIRIIKFTENAGASDVLAAGFRAATGQIIATLDADLQNPPEEIPALVNALESNAMAIGLRVTRKDSILKRIASYTANTIRRQVLQDDTYDSACGLKVVRNETVKMITMYKGMHRFFPALVQMHGGSVVAVPVAHCKREHGKSKYGTFTRAIPAFIDMLVVLWMQKRQLTYVIEEEY